MQANAVSQDLSDFQEECMLSHQETTTRSTTLVALSLPRIAFKLKMRGSASTCHLDSGLA